MLTVEELKASIAKDNPELNVSDEIAKKVINKQFKKVFPVKDRFSIWDAIVAWRDYIYNADYRRITKSNYLTGMLKLIESNVINPSIKLAKINPDWLKEAEEKIDNIHSWAPATKPPRKTCLRDFYKFALKFDPDYSNKIEGEPFHSIPSLNEMKYMLSSIQERALTKGLDDISLCEELRKINERDALIINVMFFTGCTLEDALDLKKADISDYFVRFPYEMKAIPPSLSYLIKGVCNVHAENQEEYLFLTAKGRRIMRTQVIRNLRLAARKIGIKYDLTPKVFHGYVNAYFCHDKRSNLEKFLIYCKIQ